MNALLNRKKRFSWNALTTGPTLLPQIFCHDEQPTMLISCYNLISVKANALVIESELCVSLGAIYSHA